MAQNDEFLITLRNANPIETVMGSYVNLIRRGRDYICSCPFHSEKTPSCHVYCNDTSPHFYCYGCGAGGDVITFIMKIENLDFTEAVKLLAQRSGLEVPQKNSKDSFLAKRRTRIYEMNRLAANYYYTCLLRGKDRSGLGYFSRRKLSPQTIKKFGLGYAPDSWDSLTNMLLSKGYNEDEITVTKIYFNNDRNDYSYYFGLFDGHGGKGCSNYLKKNLHQNIKEFSVIGVKIGIDITEERFITNEAVDEKGEIKDSSGSCGIILIVKDNKCIIANIGDSRLIIIKNKLIDFTTMDHKPDSIIEKSRIELAGGKIYKDLSLFQKCNIEQNLEIPW